jgi:hypothetical protein
LYSQKLSANANSLIFLTWIVFNFFFY